MDVLLKAKGVSKHFGGIQALDNIDFEVERGEIHGLVGENGAGKSTLMKIITGVYQKDEGDLWFDGSLLASKSPLQCRNLGIGMVYQESSLIRSLDVKSNIFLGKYPVRKLRGFVNWKSLKEQTQKILEELDIQIDPDIPVGQLTFGKRQMIDIAKVVAYNSKLVILDEPSSALSEDEKESLFKVMNRLKEEGTSIIYISHRLSEIFEISDKITVLRDGKLIGSDLARNLTVDSLIKMMVGHSVESGMIRQGNSHSESSEVLRVEGLSRGNVLKNISFRLHKGEILGIGGLIGSGRTELARAIFGIDRIDSGKVYVNDQQLIIDSPGVAVKHGLVLVPESRKEYGIIARMSTADNITLSTLEQFTRFSFINRSQQQKRAQNFVEKLGIKVSGLAQLVANLSGGNQQKVVLAKWLSSNPKILILDEPTRGIDVGAKGEIHRLVAKLVDEGLAVIMISSEIEEVMKLADRVLVLHEGAVAGMLNHDEISEENLLKCMHLL